MKLFLGVLAALLVTAAPARAEERLLTFYSPPIDSEPYVHASTTVTLKPDGIQAPAEPGYVLGFKEQVLVDSKDPDAKPLPVTKMMVHHLLYYTPGRVDGGSGMPRRRLPGRARRGAPGRAVRRDLTRRRSGRATACATRPSPARRPSGRSPRW